MKANRAEENQIDFKKNQLNQHNHRKKNHHLILQNGNKKRLNYLKNRIEKFTQNAL